MIEDVLRIGTELYPDILPRKRERFGCRHVEKLESRPIQAVPSHVAEGPIRGPKEGARVVPVVDALVGWLPTNSGVPIREGRARLCVIGLIRIDGERVSGLENHGSGDPPSPCYCVQRLVAVQEPLAPAEG